MTSAAWVFLGVVWTVIFSTILVSLRKILGNK